MQQQRGGGGVNSGQHGEISTQHVADGLPDMSDAERSKRKNVTNVIRSAREIEEEVEKQNRKRLNRNSHRESNPQTVESTGRPTR